MNCVRTVVVSAALLAAVGGAAGCSSSGAAGGTPSESVPATTGSIPTAAPTTAANTVTTVPADSDAAPGSAAGPSDGPSGGSNPSRCAESQLRANAAADDIAGLDRHVVRLTFTNTSGTTCTLSGFPGAAVVDASGKQVVQAKRVVGGPVGGTIEKSATLTLRAGRTAYAYLEGVSTKEQGAAQAGCDGAKYPRILVTPPNTSTPVPFTIGWPQCYSFEVHPVRIDT